MNKLLAIEGINGIGKTCFVDKFCQLNGYQKLYELADHYRGGLDFPKFSCDINEVLRQDAWFIDREIERYQEAKKLMEIGITISDRGIYSMFAFSYARRKKYGTKDESFLKSELERLIPSRIMLPWTVYLKPEITLSQVMERIRLREQDSGFDKISSFAEPYDKSFYNHLVDYYDKLADKLKSNLIIIKDLSDESCKAVNEWLLKKKEVWPRISIENIIF